MESTNPLNHLPEAVFVPLQLASYVSVASCTMYAYDWILSASEEFSIFSKTGMSSSNMVYLLSRISECVHLFFIMIVLMVPMKRCEALIVIIGTCSSVSVACTSFLFFLRVRAVYLKSTLVMVFFGTLWLVTVALNILPSSAMHAELIPGTEICTNLEQNYYFLPSTTTFANDTLIFFFITFRLTADAATERNWRACVMSVVKGEGLYRLSRSLMRSGQIYYLAVIIFFLINLAYMVSPSIPTDKQYLLVPGFAGFTNIMACRVFRFVALGMMEERPNTGLSSTKIAAAMQIDTLRVPAPGPILEVP